MPPYTGLRYECSKVGITVLSEMILQKFSWILNKIQFIINPIPDINKANIKTVFEKSNTGLRKRAMH